MDFTPSFVARAAIDQMFKSLRIQLDKAEAHAKSVGVDESVYLNWRLAPDMFNMTRQVQIACDIAGRGLARLAGGEIPSWEDKETTFAALRARVESVHEFIKGLDAAAIDANPDGDITVPMRDQPMTMKRHQFLMQFILPNVYFHTATAYANLRVCGAPLGKADFLARS